MKEILWRIEDWLDDLMWIGPPRWLRVGLPIAALGLSLAALGRGLRTCEGKTGCTVIDFGGNIDLYPQGVETDVDLDGVVKNPEGVGISEDDLFREPQEKSTAQYMPEIEEATYTPYHVPKGFETVSDKAYGIVFVSCGEKRDCIVVKSETEGQYKVLLGDKKKIWLERSGDFSDCIKAGINWCGEVEVDEQKAISRLQARLLAPEFPTGALTWHGANCCICWKTWRDVVAQ